MSANASAVSCTANFAMTEFSEVRLNRILRSSEVRPAFVGVLVVRLLAGIILGRGGGEEQGSGEPPQRPTAPKPATTLLRTPAPRRAITRIYSSYVNQNQEVLR